MTKKHFEALADALWRASAVTDAMVKERNQGATCGRTQWKACLTAISGECSSFNPQFDAARFEHRATYGHNLTQECCKP